MKTCDVKGCTMDGIWNPVLVVWAPNHRGVPIRPRVGLRLCELHRRTTKLEDILSDEIWSAICLACDTHGKVRPDRRLTGLEFAPAVDDLRDAPELRQ
jgi:hypothetical protein